MKKIITLVVLGLTFIQCQQEISVEELADDSQKVDQSVIRVLKELGFNITDFPVVKENNQYLVEEDIIITKEHLEKTNIAQKQRRTRSLISCNNLRVITIKSTITGRFNTALETAITKWNTALNGLIQFRLTNNANADIVVRNAINSDNGNFKGRAKPPMDGKSGDLIIIRPNSRIRGNRISTEKWGDIIMHEMGHTIGLAHTDSRNRELISGSPVNDRNSLMNSGDGTGNLRSLSNNDINAVNTLYARCK